MEKPEKKKSLLKQIVTAFCLCLFVVFVFSAIQFVLSRGRAGYRKQEGLTYMSYAGPVFPLTIFEQNPNLTAERTIQFDFSPYHSRTETTQINENRAITNEVYDEESRITDGYTLSSAAKEEEAAILTLTSASSIFVFHFNFSFLNFSRLGLG